MADRPVEIVSAHRTQYVGISPYLVPKILITVDGYNPISLILKSISPSPIFVFSARILVVRAVDEDADAETAFTLLTFWSIVL
jgi:hypothetical protein